jgi:hypothetical protein
VLARKDHRTMRAHLFMDDCNRSTGLVRYKEKKCTGRQDAGP